MEETQAEEEKRAESILLSTGFHGMLGQVARETGVNASAIKENLELKVYSRTNFATTVKRIKELKEYEARVYREFKRWREEERGKNGIDGETVVAWIQRYVFDPIKNGAEWFRDDFAQYTAVEPYQREWIKNGARTGSPKGRLTIYPSYFEKKYMEDKQSILAHELGHRATHVLYPGFIHAREMAFYSSENEGKNFAILLAFEEADVTRTQHAIEKKMYERECKITPDCNLKREAVLEAYLNRKGIKELKEKREKANQEIAELYKDPAKVIRDLPHLFDIK